MIQIGQDGLGRWAFMLETPVSRRLVYSAWDFETEEEARIAAFEALDLFLAAARELDARPAAVEEEKRLRIGGPE